MLKIMLLFLLCSTSAKAQSIEDLLKVAIENNLELKILENEYLAALEKAPQGSELPDPEVGLGAFPFPVETRLGPQIVRLSATQMFPWFGTLDRKADLENAKAKALYERIGAEQLNLFYQIKINYYRLYEIEQSQSIIRRNMILLESLKKLALAKVESGKTTAADVLRVQLKTVELKQELEILATAKTNPKVAINQLLNRSLETPIATVSHLSFASLSFDKDSLAANIEANHPTLRMFELQQDISRKALSLNELKGKPSFGAGLDYIMVNKRKNIELGRNGRDILQLRASLKIPLHRQKYGAKEREEKLKIAALDNKKENVRSQFFASIEKAFATYEMAQLRMALYEQQIEITEAAIRILQTTYSAKGSNFDELLGLEKELIDYDLKKLKAIVQSHIAKAGVERFVDVQIF